MTNTNVRMFGALHTFRRDRGLDPMADITIPPEGRRAIDIVRDLGLPLEKVEAVFVNHRVYNLQQVVLPGDTVAFVPTGIPGPARLVLGIFGKGQEKQKDVAEKSL